MIGDNTDMFGRLKNLLPAGWFGDNNPIRDALLWGYANALAWGYTLHLYAKAQTRIKSATDGWLDLIGLDFFGNNLVRYSDQTDASYRNRILINIFRERTTRHAMEQVLFDLTGRWPVIIEPARPADVGSYGAAVAVSRASPATYYDLNGNIATAEANVARYNTDPATGISRLLLESSATNLHTFSQDFTNSAWGKSLGTITVPGGFTPNGVVHKFVESASSGTHFLQRAFTAIAAVPYTSWRVVKAGERTLLRAQLANTSAQADWDLAAGTVTGSGTITPLGSGWYLCTITGTHVAGGNVTDRWYPKDAGGNATYLGDGVSGYYVSAGQLEQGLVATSYILAISAPATRAADILLNNMPAGSIAIGGYGVAGAYGSVLLPYQAFITAFRPLGQGLPFVSGYGISTGAYSTPSRSAYGQLSGGDVTDADIYAAIDATKPVGTVAWTRILS